VNTRFRWVVLGLVASSTLALAPVASSSGDQGQIVVANETSDCPGYLVETLAGVVTGCRPTPSDWPGTFAVAADGSIASSGEEGLGDYAPVKLLRPDGTVAVLDPTPDDFDVSISPDGSKVTFARYVGDPVSPSSDIYVVNSDGSGLREIASGAGKELLTVPTFSPDGRSIAYACNPAAYDPGSAGCGPLVDGTYRYGGLMLMDADGSDKRMIVVGKSSASAGESISWSPDGQWVAMAGSAPCSCSNGYASNDQVFVYRTDGSDLFNIDDPHRQITHEKDIVGAVLPQFSADGSQILFLKVIDDNGAAGNFPYVVNGDGSGRHQIFLSQEGAQWGRLVPAASGGGPAPTVDAMQLTVPTVHALAYRAAKRRLQAAHLTPRVTARNFSSRIPRNHVLAQFPRAGAHAHRSAKRGPRVRLVLSRGRRPSG
jgi:dipeptidyl aminopeptidase/acylaminoacyl peptidase